MDRKKQYSRVDKYEKRRKNTKAITFLSLIGTVLIVVLIGMWIFGGNDSQEEEPNMAKSNEQNEQQDPSIRKSKQKEDDSEDENERVDEDETELELEDSDETIVKEPVEGSDANVIEAYIANWKPVGTIQEGPHTTQFDKSSQDWKEMTEALVVATDLPEENMIIHWLGRGGEQQAIGTVSSKDNSEIYRVYLSWVDEEGWQPTKVEVLKEVIVP